MGYIVERSGNLWVVIKNDCVPFSGVNIKYVCEWPIIIFAELSVMGLRIVKEIEASGLKVEVGAVRLEIYSLACGNAVFKNSKNFNISLQGDYSSVYKQYNDIRIVLLRLSGQPINDRKLSSLASASAFVLKKYCPSVLRYSNVASDPIIKNNFFGGRREDFGDYSKECWYFDFKSMYGNIMLGEYPLEYSLKQSSYDINEPGFYLIDFKYNGPLLAPRLPVKSGNNVSYRSSGTGWYWHEEIIQFCRSGGEIKLSGTAICAYSCGRFMSDLSEFLMSQRGLGLECAKGILNGVFGRLAIKPTTRKTVVEKLDSSDFKLHGYARYVKHENYIMYEVESPGYGSRVRGNMCWASIISSRGRSALMDLIYSCEKKGYVVLHVNTDCVFIKSENAPTVGHKILGQDIIFKRV